MKSALLVGLSIIILMGCASTRLSDAEKNLIIEDFISSEALQATGSISSFSMDSWTPLNDKYLILRTSPFRSYLVKLFMSCNSLDHSISLLVYSRTPNTLSAGFDSVFTPNDSQFKCNISRIYPLSKEQNKALIAAIRPPEPEETSEEDASKESSAK